MRTFVSEALELCNQALELCYQFVAALIVLPVLLVAIGLPILLLLAAVMWAWGVVFG